jgi:hypothetical protein
VDFDGATAGRSLEKQQQQQQSQRSSSFTTAAAATASSCGFTLSHTLLSTAAGKFQHACMDQLGSIGNMFKI